MELKLVDDQEIISTLKRVRNLRNQTQSEFGTDLHVSKSTISRIERGEKKITNQSFFKMLKELKVDFKIKVEVDNVHTETWKVKNSLSN